MTKKDYIAIGRAMKQAHANTMLRIRENRVAGDITEKQMRDYMIQSVYEYNLNVTALAGVFQADNERFKRETFIDFMAQTDEAA